MQSRSVSKEEPTNANDKTGERAEGTNSIVGISVILRGIGVLLIIARHTLGRAYSTDEVFLRPVCILVSQFACCAIPLFFVLSGFSLSLGAGRRPRFRKYGHIVLRKILPAFTIWYFLYAILMAIKHPGTFGVLSLLSDYVRLANTGHLWFLVVLIQLYLLFALLHKLYKHPLFGRLTILFVIATVLLTQDLFQPHRSLAFAQPYVSRLFTSNTVFFVLGFYLKDFALAFTQYVRKTIVIVTCFCAAGVIQASQLRHMFQSSAATYDPDSCELTSVMAMASTVVTLVMLYMLSDWINAHCERLKTLVSNFGFYSYGIYLAHVVPMAFSYSVLRLFIHADNDIVVFGNMIATIVLTRLFVKGLSKMPFSQYYV